MKAIKKLFGGLHLTWPKLILFAVIAGVYTGLINQVPFLYNTSFRDIAIFFDRWVLFGILIIMNAKSNLDAALKCFVFFLISQPLVYLVEVPFLGWQIMGFYRNWILWTILTFPMGFVGYFMKKDKWWGLAILTPMLALVAIHYHLYLNQTVFSFPRHLYSALFCGVTMLLYALCIFSEKRVRIAGVVISALLLVGMTTWTILQPPVYSTEIIYSSKEADGVDFDDSYKAYFTDDSYGTLSIRYEEALDGYMVHADIRKAGNAEVVLEAPNGKAVHYQIAIEDGTYEIEKSK
ncbi:hypothetical protein [Ruminococcus sp.]|uniref:hypothetical protein n=1 Tax=Ruminococcus sp. TaxID=41978 RepID=UPI00388F49D8